MKTDSGGGVFAHVFRALMCDVVCVLNSTGTRTRHAHAYVAKKKIVSLIRDVF